MRKKLRGSLEVGRNRKGRNASTPANNSCSEPKRSGIQLMILSSDGMGWEHVSVSTEFRIPLWEEMCWVKDLFWEEGECVIQYHPPRSKYVNVHPNCLHLWKPLRTIIPVPP